MRDLDLLNEYLVRLRQEKLQRAHQVALDTDNLLQIRINAWEAELCSRIQAAVKVLAKDPGQFLKEFLP